MNRWVVGLVAVAALVPAGSPRPAQATTGRFVYWQAGSTPGQDGPRHELRDPPTGPCQPLGTGQATGAPISKAENDTASPAAVYQSRDCTGHSLTIPAGATRSAGGHGPAAFNSVKFRPTP